MRLQDLPAALTVPQAAEILGSDVTWPTRPPAAASCRRFGRARRLLIRTGQLLELLGAEPGERTACQGEDTLVGGWSWQDGLKTGAEPHSWSPTR